MEVSIKENGLENTVTDLGYNFGHKVQNMKDIGRMINLMGMEHSTFQMETLTKVTGLLEKHKDMVCSKRKMGIYSKGNG